MLGFASCFLVLPQLLTSQSNEDQIVQHFRQGQYSMLQGEFANAVEEFKQVLALDPNLVEAQVNLGLAYQSLDQFQLAVQFLTGALRQKPTLVAPNVIVGMDYVKLGFSQKAIPYLQRAVSLDPKSLEAHQTLASIYLAQDNFQNSAREYHQIAALDSDQSNAWFKLGHEYLDLSARLAYRGARLYRDSAWGHRFLGDLLFERSRWDEAEREYNKALAIEPHQDGLAISLGQSYLRAGQFDKADAEFEREIQFDKANPPAWLALAELRLAQNQPDKALDAIGRAWQISPEFVALQRESFGATITPDAATKLVSGIDQNSGTPAAQFLLATLYAAAGDGAHADEEWKHFQIAVATTARSNHTIEPDACRTHRYSACIHLLQTRKILSDAERLVLGKNEFTMQQYDSAAQSLAEVKGVSTQNAEASYWLSCTYQALGADAYAQLQEAFPDSWRTHQLRGESDALRSDYDNAAKEFQAALQIQPASAELHEALGELYLDKGSDADAERELNIAVTDDPASSRALYFLGRLYFRQHDNEKAVPVLQKAIHLQPDFAEASSLLGTALMHLGRYADAVPNLENAAAVDHYGNVHYQLFVALRQLGKTEQAQKALAVSESIRRSSLEQDQATIMGTPQDNDAQ